MASKAKKQKTTTNAVLYAVSHTNGCVPTRRLLCVTDADQKEIEVLTDKFRPSNHNSFVARVNTNKTSMAVVDFARPNLCWGMGWPGFDPEAKYYAVQTSDKAAIYLDPSEKTREVILSAYPSAVELEPVPVYTLTMAELNGLIKDSKVKEAADKYNEAEDEWKRASEKCSDIRALTEKAVASVFDSLVPDPKGAEDKLLESIGCTRADFPSVSKVWRRPNGNVCVRTGADTRRTDEELASHRKLRVGKYKMSSAFYYNEDVKALVTEYVFHTH